MVLFKALIAISKLSFYKFIQRDAEKIPNAEIFLIIIRIFWVKRNNSDRKTFVGSKETVL